MYGFELVRMLDENGGLVTSLGTIYPLLSRLRNDDLVTTSTRASESGPARRYYEITGPGRRTLAAFIEAWSQFRDSVDELFDSTGRHP